MVMPVSLGDVARANKQLGETARAFLTAARHGEVIVMEAIGHAHKDFDFSVTDEKGNNGADLAKEGGYQEAVTFMAKKGITPKSG